MQFRRLTNHKKSSYLSVFNNVSSAQFIKKYQQPSASSIQSAIKGLTEKEILTQEDGCYRIYDYFLAYWIARVY